MDNDTQALQALVEQLTQRVQELELSVQASERRGPIDRPESVAVGRRGLMKAAAGAAVGGAAALVAMPHGQAAAVNGEDLKIGNRGAGQVGTQTATSPTQINYTGTEDIGFVVQSGSSFSATSSSFDAALAGWTSRNVNPVGVYGFSNSSVSSGSIGVLGRSDGSNGAGVRGSGGFGSADGVVGETTSSSRSGVRGEGPVAMRANGSQVGIIASGPDGVRTEATRYGVTALGSVAPLLVPPTGLAQPPELADPHVAGEVRVNQVTGATDGEAWVCVEAGTPGIWRRLAGPDTAGAFTAIDPGRGYDSRTPTPFRQVLAGGEDRVISVADARDLDTGEVTVADIVPAGATAIAYNLTVTNTTGGGFLAVTPGDATAFGAAAINWGAPGTTVGNAGIVKLDDSRQIKVFAGGGTTDFIVDITGFFL